MMTTQGERTRVNRPQPVIRLLVSVRNGEEAAAALAGGADIIDVKEPRHGPLGQPTLQQVDEVVQVVADRAPISVAWGDLPQTAPGHLPAGIGFVKCGLAGTAHWPDWPSRWQRLLQTVGPPCRPIAVIYADWQQAQTPPPPQILHWGAQLGCQGLLIDTFDKTIGNRWIAGARRDLQQWIDDARQRQWFVALAGSLTLADLPTIEHLQPDIVGIRGAACTAGRNSTVAAERVQQFQSALAAIEPSLDRSNAGPNTESQLGHD